MALGKFSASSKSGINRSAARFTELMLAFPASPGMGSLKPQPGRSSMMHRNPLRPCTRLAQLVPQTEAPWMRTTGGPSPSSWIRTATSRFFRWTRFSVGFNPSESHNRLSAVRYLTASNRIAQFGTRPHRLQIGPTEVRTVDINTQSGDPSASAMTGSLLIFDVVLALEQRLMVLARRPRFRCRRGPNNGTLRSPRSVGCPRCRG